ncbi:MAG: hypothetical protein IT352_15755 [Gemmatimonadales bacterium]|nr:hypothetical protein [Gemmatimonadales bacterium]
MRDTKIGDRLAKWVKQRAADGGLARWASLYRINYKTANRWLQGGYKAAPDLDNLALLARAGLNVDWLLTGRGEPDRADAAPAKKPLADGVRAYVIEQLIQGGVTPTLARAAAEPGQAHLDYIVASTRLRAETILTSQRVARLLQGQAAGDIAAINAIVNDPSEAAKMVISTTAAAQHTMVGLSRLLPGVPPVPQPDE